MVRLITELGEANFLPEVASIGFGTSSHRFKLDAQAVDRFFLSKEMKILVAKRLNGARLAESPLDFAR